MKIKIPKFLSRSTRPQVFDSNACLTYFIKNLKVHALEYIDGYTHSVKDVHPQKTRIFFDENSFINMKNVRDEVHYFSRTFNHQQYDISSERTGETDGSFWLTDTHNAFPIFLHVALKSYSDKKELIVTVAEGISTRQDSTDNDVQLHG